MERQVDKRRFTRVPIAYRVKILAGERVLQCPSAANISMSGILIPCDEPLPVGTSCHIILFMLENGIETKILAWGTVVRSTKEGVAVRFSRILGRDGQENLRQLVLMKSPDPDRAKTEFEAFVKKPTDA